MGFSECATRQETLRMGFLLVCAGSVSTLRHRPFTLLQPPAAVSAAGFADCRLGVYTVV